MRVFSIGFAVAALSSAVLAQTPTPASPAVATVAPRPAHNCVPPEDPGRLATKSQQSVYSENVKAYTECLKAFVKAETELVKLHTDMMKLHTDVANSAVKEFNDFVTKISKSNAEAAK